MREPDTSQRRAGLEDRKGSGAPEAVEDKEDGGASLFPHQIVDFTPAPASAPAQPVLSRTFPHPRTPLHCHIR